MQSRLPLGPGKFHVVVLVLIRLRTRKCDVKPANSTTERILGFVGNKTVMRKHLHQVIGAVVYFTSV